MLRTDAAYDVASLIRPIERAFKNDRVTELARTLAHVGAAGALDDERLFAPPRADHYARRLIWRDPHNRFTVIGMTWAPGQSSPLHDHAGYWGAEIICAGVFREVTYRLLDRDSQGRCMFVRDRESQLTRGGISTLLPPLEYHEFGNAGTTTAYSLHVYGGDLERCNAFDADGGGWWRPREVALRYDA